jgi:organic radical activating enzyme
MGTINFQNVRVGFNTSSSSQHSAVINVNPKLSFEPPDYYGWENFILKSTDDKEHYFATMLFCNLGQHMPDSYARAVVNSLFGEPVLERFDRGGFDHQSVFTLPTTRDSIFWTRVNEINMAFFQEMSHYFVDNPEIAICGGNDNEERPNYGEEDLRFNLLFEHLADRHDSFVARQDGDFWVLFNKRTGTKLRLSFVSDAHYTQSTYPESADIKITDFCPFECDFCYQGSTMHGSFSHPKQMDEIARSLSNLGVFEVALGGGEPTFHPHLGKIIDAFSDQGICTNLTTRSKEWLKNPVLAETILTKVKGLAFSVGADYKTLFDFREVARWLRQHNYKGELSAHYVTGYESTNQMISDIKQMSEHVNRITLLGRKITGRGNNRRAVKVDMKRVLEHCKKSYITLGMDTKAVIDYSEAIKEVEIPEILVARDEGKFSLYIDAVEQFIAPDSYNEGSAARKVPFSYGFGEDNSLEKVIRGNFPF